MVRIAFDDGQFRGHGNLLPVHPGPFPADRIDRLKRGIVTVLHPEAIYGPPLEFRKAIEVLRRINLLSALQVMAVLNRVAADIDTEARKRQDSISPHLAKLLNFLLPKQRIGRAVKVSCDEMAAAMVDGMGYFTPLAPWACLALTDACLRYCSLDASAKTIWPPAEFGDFGRTLLSFQKAITPENKKKNTPLDLDNLTDAQFTEFTRNQITANLHTASNNDTTRIYAMFEVAEVGNEFMRRAHKEPADWFASITGLTPLEYRLLVTAIIAPTAEFKLDAPDLKSLTVNLDDYARNMTASARASFLRLMLTAEIDIPSIRSESRPQTWAEALFRNNALLRRQLFRVGPNTFLILDRTLFASRFFHGVIHVLGDALKQSKVMSFDRMRSDIGYLFEGYVQWWFKRLLGPSAEYFFGSDITDGKETDVVAILDGVAIVAEANHHWLTLDQIYEGSPSRFADVVVSDFEKAIRAAKSLISKGVHRNGKRINITCIIPVAIIPDPLPISDITTLRFKAEVAKKVPDSVGIPPIILPCQILTHEHLEFFDRVWDLPLEGGLLTRYLVDRAQLDHLRYSPVAGERGSVKRSAKSGNTWSKLAQEAHDSFVKLGTSLFVEPTSDDSPGAGQPG